MSYNPIVQQTSTGDRGAFWHPFSQLHRSLHGSVTLVAGHGSTLVDSEGREYLDATAALWYSLIGHGRNEIAEAVAAQMRTLEACSCFDVYASDRTLELADRVAELVPIDGAWVFFTSGGSDSVETAAKVARLYWAEVGRPTKRTIVHRAGSYHGMHGVGTSLAGIEGNRAGIGDLADDAIQVAMFDVAALEAEIKRVGEDRVAAFIAEPVIAAGGVHPPPEGYLAAAADVCAEHEVLFIADEVVTGFGRTGCQFGCDRYRVRPDVIIIAKGLTSGYLPLGATVFSPRVVEPFVDPDSPWLRHGYTYSGHATACAAALTNLDLIRREALIDRVRSLEPALETKLGGLAERPGVREVRTVGLTAAVELDGDWGDGADIGHRVVDACRRRGVLTRLLAGASLQISPPFIVGEAEIDRIAEMIDEALGEVIGNGGTRSAA